MHHAVSTYFLNLWCQIEKQMETNRMYEVQWMCGSTRIGNGTRIASITVLAIGTWVHFQLQEPYKIAQHKNSIILSQPYRLKYDNAKLNLWCNMSKHITLGKTLQDSVEKQVELSSSEGKKLEKRSRATERQEFHLPHEWPKSLYFIMKYNRSTFVFLLV